MTVTFVRATTESGTEMKFGCWARRAAKRTGVSTEASQRRSSSSQN
jgi:hypothetical protein